MEKILLVSISVAIIIYVSFQVLSLLQNEPFYQLLPRRVLHILRLTMLMLIALIIVTSGLMLLQSIIMMILQGFLGSFSASSIYIAV